LARITEDGSLAILSAAMFDAQYWALIKNNSGKNVPEKVSLRPFLMVSWHNYTYLNLVSKVRNGFIPHLYSAIIRATEKASLRQMPIQQFTRKASRPLGTQSHKRWNAKLPSGPTTARCL